MSTPEYTFHPLANIWPLIEGQELEDLVASIKAEGLHFPITIWKGQILDGRNRYIACKQAGVQPEFVLLSDETHPLLFVLSANNNRRHSTKSQIAIAYLKGVDVWESLPDTDRTPQQNEIAKALKISKTTISKGVAVMKDADAGTIKDIEAGKKSITAAYNETQGTKTKTTPRPPLAKKSEMSVEALKVIAENCGKEFARAIYDEKIPMKAKDITRMAKMKKEEMVPAARLIASSHCTLWEAEKAISKMIQPTSRVLDVINQFIAAGAPKQVFELNGHRITVEKIA